MFLYIPSHEWRHVFRNAVAVCNCMMSQLKTCVPEAGVKVRDNLLHATVSPVYNYLSLVEAFV